MGLAASGCVIKTHRQASPPSLQTMGQRYAAGPNQSKLLHSCTTFVDLLPLQAAASCTGGLISAAYSIFKNLKDRELLECDPVTSLMTGLPGTEEGCASIAASSTEGHARPSRASSECEAGLIASHKQHLVHVLTAYKACTLLASLGQAHIGPIDPSIHQSIHVQILTRPIRKRITI